MGVANRPPRPRVAASRLSSSASDLSHCSKAAQADQQSAFIRSEIAVILANAGCPEDAERLLTRLEERWTEPDVSPFFLAKIHTHLGRADRAFDELTRGLKLRSSWMLDIKVDPELEPLRSDPRYGEILTAMQL